MTSEERIKRLEDEVQGLQKECKRLIDIKTRAYKYFEMVATDPKASYTWLEQYSTRMDMFRLLLDDHDRKLLEDAEKIDRQYTRMWEVEDWRNQMHSFMGKILINEIIKRMYHYEEASCGCL